jgi:hypothetical protein
VLAARPVRPVDFILGSGRGARCPVLGRLGYASLAATDPAACRIDAFARFGWLFNKFDAGAVAGWAGGLFWFLGQGVLAFVL